MPSVITNYLILVSFFFLSSCFGPVKELKYQIEDSWDDSLSFVDNPSALNKINNEFDVKSQLLFSGAKSLRNFQISISANLLVQSGTNGEILAFDILENRTMWEYKHALDIISSISSDNKYIYFVDSEGFLCSLTISGKLEWKKFVGEVYSPPLILENSIIIRNTSNYFSSIHKLDGSELWTYQLNSSPLAIRSWGEMAFENETIYIGAPGGKIAAINSQNGSLIWETTYSQPKGVSEIERSNDTSSKPIVNTNIVYVVSSSGNIAAILRDDGSLLWSRPLSSFLGMTENDKHLYVTHNSGSIYALSKETNKVIWKNDSLLGRDVSVGFIYKNNLIYSDFEGYIHFIDQDNGKTKARFKLASALLLKPIYLEENDKLVIASIDGQVFEVKINETNDLNHITNNTTNNEIGNSNDLSNRHPNDQDESFFDNFIFW